MYGRMSGIAFPSFVISERISVSGRSVNERGEHHERLLVSGVVSILTSIRLS